MSCYNWERGEVKIPVKYWKAVRNSIYADYNAHLRDCYDYALEIYEQIKHEKKGVRGFKVEQRARQLAEQRLSKSTYDNGVYYFAYKIAESLTNRENKLVKPKKKDFAPAKASKGETLYDSDLCISFDNKAKVIKYYSDDNNRAVEAARESALGRAFFSTMKYVKFTTKTGGYLRYYDEYMQDEGQGANLSETWGKYDNRKYQRGL